MSLSSFPSLYSIAFSLALCSSARVSSTFPFPSYAMHRSATYTYTTLMYVIYEINLRLTINLTDISLIQLSVRTIFPFCVTPKPEYLLTPRIAYRCIYSIRKQILNVTRKKDDDIENVALNGNRTIASLATTVRESFLRMN